MVWGIDHKSEMYKLPAMYVKEYAEQDAVLTLQTLARDEETNHEETLKTSLILRQNYFHVLLT